jgi:major membrane immunogen (membrane-anchored lipoprotein)
LNANWKTLYKVKLDNGKITYIGDYKCKECGWVSNDIDFFTEIDENLYCSLHKDQL